MKKYMLLMLLAAVLAGCTAPGQQAEEDKPKVIEVQGPECVVGGQRCSAVTLTKYDDPVRITLTVANNGDEPMEVFLDRENRESMDNFGRRVLTSKCNDEIARISSYEVRKESSEGVTTWGNGDTATGMGFPPASTEMESDSRLTLTWDLEIPDDLQVSQLGYSCPLSFDLEFQQELGASRQIQLKESRSVPDVRSLDSTRTSRFPVRLVIDAPDSAVAEEGRTLSVSGYLRNVGPGEIMRVNSLEEEPGSWLASNAEDCRPDDIRMYRSGERSGESYRRTCTVPLSPPDTSSDIEWLRYDATYRYQMPLSPSEINLEIEPVAGGSG